MKTLIHSGLSRRRFLMGSASIAGLTVSGCTTPNTQIKLPNFFTGKANAPNGGAVARAEAEVLYGARPNEKFPIPAVDLSKVDAKYYRREVTYASSEAPGTVIVDTRNFYLYLVQGDNRAMRYGVGLGRQGFEWSGRAKVQWKQAWPKWTPPDEMIERQPELEKYSADNGGMPPGLTNPLGARALYIFQDGVDTLYRIHGTPEYWTIGKAVSSGCVRMMNQDVIDLYDRARTGVPILVI
ncbi:MAG: L,D-transpeptidase [Salaquimonas sp.]